MPFFAGLLVDVNVDPCFLFECFGCTRTRQSASRTHGKVIAVLLKGSELANLSGWCRDPSRPIHICAHNGTTSPCKSQSGCQPVTYREEQLDKYLSEESFGFTAVCGIAITRLIKV